MLNLGPICTYCIHLNKYKKLITCARKMLNKKSATTLHCSCFQLVLTFQRSTCILLFIEIHSRNDVPLPNGLCLFLQNTGFLFCFYWISFSFLGYLNSEQLNYNFSHFTTFNCLKELNNFSLENSSQKKSSHSF